MIKFYVWWKQHLEIYHVEVPFSILMRQVYSDIVISGSINSGKMEYN